MIVKNIFHLFGISIFSLVFYDRFWLNTDVKIIDARLGWIQKTFELTGDEMRQVIVTEPRVIIYGIGPLEVSSWMKIFFIEIPLKFLILVRYFRNFISL